MNNFFKFIINRNLSILRTLYEITKNRTNVTFRGELLQSNNNIYIHIFLILEK